MTAIVNPTKQMEMVLATRPDPHWFKAFHLQRGCKVLGARGLLSIIRVNRQDGRANLDKECGARLHCVLDRHPAQWLIVHVQEQRLATRTHHAEGEGLDLVWAQLGVYLTTDILARIIIGLAVHQHGSTQPRRFLEHPRRDHGGRAIPRSVCAGLPLPEEPESTRRPPLCAGGGRLAASLS